MLFHANARHDFLRTVAPAPLLVVKTVRNVVRNQDALETLRHEFTLLDGLALPGVARVRALQTLGESVALVMEDAGAQNLASLLAAGALPLALFLDVAVSLASAVMHMHEAGIIHRKLQPANVVLDAASGQATVVDFSLAISLARLEAGQSGQTFVSATGTAAATGFDAAAVDAALAYMSPEQTGRTGQNMDMRGDLYSLGAMLYHMLTGAQPFATRDRMELVHAHLARVPKPPHLVDAAIPAVLSAMVMKLLEKEPQQRYQSARGLLSDLQFAQARWKAEKDITSFILAQNDMQRQLRVPEKLYGRESETALLLAALERVDRGRRELLLVTGAPGIGKSALVLQLGAAVKARQGYFIAGKFDQLQRNIPYAGLVLAFRMLLRQLLTESDTALALWRERIAVAVAPNAHILADVIPEVETILGATTPVAQLGALEARNRFNQVLTSFVSVFARPDHALVLFLDDLQWVDAGLLQLMQQWLADSASGHLLITGAYRDDEVGATHPLALALGEMARVGRDVQAIHMLPLTRECITELLANTLDQPSLPLPSANSLPSSVSSHPAQPEHPCSALAELLLKKTAGNPFFIRRLLLSLHADNLIHFDAATRTWRWDMEEIRRAPVSDNVLQLMTQAIDRLPEAARNLVQAGACIGHRFDLDTLAAVAGLSAASVTNLLWPALADGLLVLQENVTVPAPASPSGLGGKAALSAATGVTMRFVHDRVQ